jgi:hypothetical protein
MENFTGKQIFEIQLFNTLILNLNPSTGSHSTSSVRAGRRLNLNLNLNLNLTLNLNLNLNLNLPYSSPIKSGLLSSVRNTL